MLLGACGLILCAYTLKKIGVRRRKYKIRPINSQRKTEGGYHYFLKMKAAEPEQFFKFTRMTVPVFEHLLNLVESKISRGARSDGICAEERLAITLQYLSQGGSMQSLAWTFHVGITTVHQIIHETNEIIWEVLSPTYLKTPSTANEWQMIASDFYSIWNFPNCIGALDGKHISIQAPSHSGSMFFNYKKHFSIVLLATCTAKYVFTMVDIGALGSQSDGGVFRDSIFGTRLEENTLSVPEPSYIPNTRILVPYMLTADEAFPLKHYIMRPYPGKNLSIEQRTFNYRLSRARRTIENTFGILVARWRVLKQTICAKVENIDGMVKATVVLHNYCVTMLDNSQQGNIYCPPGYADVGDGVNGLWRSEVEPLPSVGRLSSNNATRMNYTIRNNLANYFVSAEGSVPWQNERIFRGTIA